MTKKWLQVGSTDYHLKSDRLNWIVARQVECKRSKSFQDSRKLVNETYHNTLAGAFRRIYEETVKLAEAKALKDILQVCEDTYKMLREVLERDFVDSK